MEELNELEEKIVNDYMEDIIKKINLSLGSIDYQLPRRLSAQAKKVIIDYLTIDDSSINEPKICLCMAQNGKTLKKELRLYIAKHAIDQFLLRLPIRPQSNAGRGV